MSTEHDEKMKWPETEEAATADALITHGARLAMSWSAEKGPLSRRAFSLAKDDPERPTALRKYLDAVSAMIAEAQVVAALVAVQKVSREQADELARHLWLITEDGGLVHELMFDYLDERGIPSEEVWNDVEALVQDQLAPVEGSGS